MGYLIVLLGGGIGSALRYGVNIAAASALGAAFPSGILLINISGSFVIGLVAAYFAIKGDASQDWRLFLTTGILGGNTTFSAFSLDTTLLYERGEIGMAALLCRSFGGVVDWRAVCQLRAGAQLRLSASPSPLARVCRVAPYRGRVLDWAW
jgi:CrcB protein